MLPVTNSSAATRAITFVSALVGRSGMPGNSAVTGARSRRSWLMPLRPTARYDAAGCCGANRSVARTRFTFIGPTSPRSVVTRTIPTRLTGRLARSGLVSGSAYGARSFRTVRSRSSYGRDARTAACARRIFDAATSCIARVTCWMFLMLRTRRRSSRSDGTLGLCARRGLRRRLRRCLRLLIACRCRHRGFLVRVRIGLLELVEHRADFLLDGGVPLLVLGDLRADALAYRIHEAIQVALVVGDALLRYIVDESVCRREDDHDLLLER